MSLTTDTWLWAKYPAIWLGNSRMLTAKMIGMTPAWLTRSGRNVVPPWYIRRPRTRLAYWIGMRRWPSVTKTIAAMAATPKMAKTTSCLLYTSDAADDLTR